MILELVTFKTPAGWDRAQVLEDAKHTIPKWVANRDLLRKHFVLGVGANEAAKKAHNDEWREAVKTRSGGYPTMQYFDLFLLIDNEHGQVIEWTADGKARELEAT